MSDTKELAFCRVCREEIKPGAQKCIHCQSAQGWQRHLSLSSTVLALLIALISVLQSALPTFIAMYKGDASNVSMHFLKANGLSLIFAASNSGTRPGTLAYGTLTLPGDVVRFSLNGDSAVDLILPAQTTPIRLTFDDGSVDQLRQDVEKLLGVPPESPGAGAAAVAVNPPVRATLAVEVIQFDNSRTQFTWPVFVLCGGKSCTLLDKEPSPLGGKS